MSLVKEINRLLNELFPICRSLTGEGNRKTLKKLKKLIPLKIKEYKSGEKVFDWIIPEEWNIKDAWIKDHNGKKIVDFKSSNIHVVGYSKPVSGKYKFDKIKEKIHYLPKLPQAIPYRTTYYNKDWGFCVNKKQYDILQKTKGNLEVLIDSSFKKNGSMSFGEYLVKGKSKKEILVSTYICHPSLANDNLSGLVLTTFLARKLSQQKPNFTWRFLFIPETIGSIAYCAKNYEIMKKIDTALVISCVGGPGKFSYKQSHNKNHFINKMIEKVFNESKLDYKVYPFDIHGSDERQYSSIGFRINTATISKDKYYEYKYYHTSLDNLKYVKSQNILKSYYLYLKLIKKLDQNIIFKSKNPNCEVMLSKHKLYPELGGSIKPTNSSLSFLEIRLWLLFLLDGEKTLSDISKIIKVEEKTIYDHCIMLERKRIIQRVA